jgi:acetoin utilization protein AcuB
MNEIKHFMAAAVHAIGHDQPLVLAHERMQQWGVRQLPVLDGGELVGVISERDIALVEAIAPSDIATTTVEEAMSSEPYAVAPDADIADVTQQMAADRHSCAIVMDQHKVVGVFTTTQALELLSSLLRGEATLPPVTQVMAALRPAAKQARK